MIRLQRFGHKDSSYDRPNEPWVCGWAAIGQPCRVGPDRRGHCQATFECRPLRHGDRWDCTRPGTAGGRCTEGPLPDGTCAHAIPRCVPVRSQRSWRGYIAGMTFVTLLGLLSILLGGSSAAWLVSPGPLSVRHGAIHNCGDCHISFASGPVGWLHATFVEASVATTARPCLVCHKLGDHPLSAHGVDGPGLVKLGQDVLATKPSGPVPTQTWAASTPADFTLPQIAQRDVACAACHREHRGGGAPLKAVHSAICQECHVVRFASLARGHPDFIKYPFRRRLRTIFDHAKHFDQHFAQSKKALVPAGCTSCHEPGPARRLMTVKPFETACAGCHLGDIKEHAGAEVQGVAVLGVPALDLQTLQAHKAAIGQWPAEADGELGPFPRFLLALRADTRKDLATLGTVSIGDLSHASDAQIAAAARIAWAIKEQLYDVSLKGPAILADAVVKSDGGAGNAADLIGGLPADAVRGAVQVWFPALAKEVSLHRAGKPVPIAAAPGPSPAPPAPSPAPPPPSAPAAPAGQEPIAGAPSHGSILGGGGILGATPSSQPAPGQEATPPSDHGSILGGGGILGGAPAAPPQPALEATPPGDNGSILGGGGILGGAPAAPLAAGPPSAPPPGQEATPPGDHGSILGGGGILGGAPAGPPEAGPASAPPEPPPPAQIGSEAWTDIGGGWYRQDYFLYYRPAGHDDRFLPAWLDLTGRQARGDNDPADRLFGLLSKPDAPGACGKCHSVDRGPQGVRVVNWQPFRPNPAQRGFTTFSHEPHLTTFGAEGCKTCHQFVAASDFSATYKNGDPHVFAASFKPIEKQLCANCHVADQASAACTTCHNYHVGDLPRALVAAPTRNEATGISEPHHGGRAALE
jgi:hypothetical protein